MSKDMEKYEIYKTMHDNLTKAMRNSFYYEAIFIEYAILEDRLRALLLYAGIPTEKDGKEHKISKKISMIQSRLEYQAKYIRGRLPLEMLEQLRDWINRRNALIHNMANIPYDDVAVRQVAEEGNEWGRLIQNRSKSVINYLKKQQGGLQ